MRNHTPIKPARSSPNSVLIVPSKLLWGDPGSASPEKEPTSHSPHPNLAKELEAKARGQCTCLLSVTCIWSPVPCFPDMKTHKDKYSTGIPLGGGPVGEPSPRGASELNEQQKLLCRLLSEPGQNSYLSGHSYDDPKVSTL